MPDTSTRIASLISDYKDHIRQTKLEDELYKWRLVEQYKGRPDLEADDFRAEIRDVKYKNLVYQIAPRVAKHIVEERPDEYRKALQDLFDESRAIGERITTFEATVNGIYEQIKTKESFGSYHDERTISAILSVKYPERYTFYKDSFYRKFCGLLEIPSAKAGAKFVHYLEIIADLKDQYLLKDLELLELVDSCLTQDCYRDPSRLLLAQDILYQMLEKSDVANYWVFQANPNHYDLADGLRTGGIDTWTVTKHLKNIKTGDKVILWSTGTQAGCYALAEVTHEPVESNGTFVAGIEVTDNLVETPLLQGRVRSTGGLQDLKAGTQGTVFSATKKQYELIRKLIESAPASLTERPKFWLYAPGEAASEWDDFYSEGVMALGWKELGDLTQYTSKEEILSKLQQLNPSEAEPRNDALANFEFVTQIEPGDIVIPKRGRTTYLGYGVVTSGYMYDGARGRYSSLRKVKWKKKGEWEADFKVSLKTLTDITKYPEYVIQLKELIGIEKSDVITRETQITPLNIILYGPPGTGKTYATLDRAVSIVDAGATDNHGLNKARFDELRRQGQIEFVTFHQNYAYEDFMVGIRPDLDDQEKLRFQAQKGIFYRIAKRARDNYDESRTGTGRRPFDEVIAEILEPIERGEEVPIVMASGISFRMTEVSEKSISFTKQSGGTAHTLSLSTLRDVSDGSREVPGGLGSYYTPLVKLINERRETSKPAERLKNFVVVIDEINRANISRVFGELITLLEEDKRLGAENELRVTLPNGEKDFGVPPNLYIVGTMNTADKSIALVDIALRRRFEFVGFHPRPDLLSVAEGALLAHINARIFEKKKSADYLIGHAYFMSGRGIEDVLRRKVVPLLSEYFSGKPEIIKDIFDGSGWSVTFNTSTFDWDIGEV